MTANVLQFPSRRLLRQSGPRGFQCSAPQRHGVEIVRLDCAIGDDVDFFEDVAPGKLGSDRALNTTNKTLVDADPLGELLLREPFVLTPVGKFHAAVPSQIDASSSDVYVTPSYLVNGHGNKTGSQYAAVAYILVMHPGNRIRALRKAANLRQEDLAELTGYSQDRISNYENGRRPMRLVEMRVLARGLGCAVADLLDDSDNPDRLNEEEGLLLRAFRQSPEAARSYLLTSALAVSEPSEGQSERAA